MKNVKIYILINIMPFFLQLVVRFVYLTSKKRFHHCVDIKDESLLVAMWHGDLLMQALNYRKFRKNGKIKVIVSQHKDGIIIRKVCKYLGVLDIQGSSSKGGIRALLNAMKEIQKGVDVAITPDGPRGPRFSVAKGIIAIAQKTNTRIIALNSIPSRYWKLKSWDQFVIPKPFGIIDFYISEPFSITNLNLADSKELIKNKLLMNSLK